MAHAPGTKKTTMYMRNELMEDLSKLSGKLGVSRTCVTSALLHYCVANMDAGRVARVVQEYVVNTSALTEKVTYDDGQLDLFS